MTVGSVAEAVGGAVAAGDASAALTDMAGLRVAGPGDLSLVGDKKYARIAAGTQATALLAPEGFEVPETCGAAIIRVPQFEAAMLKAAQLFALPEPPRVEGVHPSAAVSPDAVLGGHVSVGPCAVVEAEAHVGDEATVGPQAFVGFGSVIGAGTRLGAGVTICHHCEVGRNVILHPGVVIGGDGFGYVFKGRGHEKIPQLGRVVIEDDVEIGSNTTVDRARFGATRIGCGTKIDNLVMIAHNVQIGRHCILTGQCGIAGSTVLGDYVMLGAQSGLVGHIQVGDKARVAAQAGVSKDIAAGMTVLGAPADRQDRAARRFAVLRRLPELAQTVKELAKEVGRLSEARGD